MTLLLVEDEDRIATFLVKGLSAHGYHVKRVSTGAEALAGIAESQLVILDLGLPDLDGFEVLKRLRADGAQVPVVILTARDEIDDLIVGLDLGADDYLTKPFAFDELLARIRARLRHREKRDERRLVVGAVSLDLRTRRARVEGNPEIELSGREFALLETFLRHPGQVLSREQLLSRVWGYDFDPGTNVVDVYVGYLRRKLGKRRIESVRGMGYRLRDRPDR